MIINIKTYIKKKKVKERREGKGYRRARADGLEDGDGMGFRVVDTDFSV